MGPCALCRTWTRRSGATPLRLVELYESTPGATVKGIAADLGVERVTLRSWLDRHGTGSRTAADGTTTRDPRSGRDRAATRAVAPVREETPEQRLARLEAENTALRAEKTKLETEREILRQAAKYFAGETRW